ncbi:MAG: O-antigen ligase family protein [Methylohalobius sp.]|nr:O-antigen ligase family protein [Methylohalobius sp.]
MQPIASIGWQTLLFAYAFFASVCFQVLLPEVKITWVLYANLALVCCWRYLTRLWRTTWDFLCRHSALSARLKITTDGWQALLLAYAIFLGVCLLVVVHGKKIWTLYAALIIPWSWRYLPELWNTVATSRLYRSILLYLGFLLASIFWSPEIEPKAVLSTLASAITIAHFLLLTAGLRARHPEAFDLYLGRLCFLAASSAILVIAAWYSQYPFPQSRMEGFGYLDNPIQGAAVFGTFAVIAWHRMIHSSSRLGYGLVFAAVLAYVCLSWTRSVLIAIGASLVFLTAMQLNRQTLLSLSLVGSAMLVLGSLSPELTAKLTRPEPYRPYIWIDALTEAIRHPWFGQGYFADPSGVAELADGSLYRYTHSHSFFIENLRIGGIVGLGLAVWLSGYSLYQTFKRGIVAGNFLPLALLIYGFLCIAPNGWELLPGVRIKEVWMMFWLPLGFAVSEELRLVSALTGVQPTSPAFCEAPDSDPASRKR